MRLQTEPLGFERMEPPPAKGSSQVLGSRELVPAGQEKGVSRQDVLAEGAVNQRPGKQLEGQPEFQYFCYDRTAPDVTRSIVIP